MGVREIGFCKLLFEPATLRRPTTHEHPAGRDQRVSTITLSKKERADIIESARADMVRALIAEAGEELHLVSQSQAAGLLDCNVKTLDSIGVPKVVFSPTIIRYRISDLKDFIARKRVGGDHGKTMPAASASK